MQLFFTLLLLYWVIEDSDNLYIDALNNNYDCKKKGMFIQFRHGYLFFSLSFSPLFYSPYCFISRS